MFPLELINQDDPAREILPTFTNHRKYEHSDIVARHRRSWWDNFR
jgi:hypothetical protein